MRAVDSYGQAATGVGGLGGDSDGDVDGLAGQEPTTGYLDPLLVVWVGCRGVGRWWKRVGR